MSLLLFINLINSQVLYLKVVTMSTKWPTFQGRVDEFDKTAIQEQRIQRQLLGFYKDHLVPKNIYEKICPIGLKKKNTVIWSL